MELDHSPDIELRELARIARRRMLAMHRRSNMGHLGGNLSCIDALLTLYHRILAPQDSFILSKGHAAGALYIALWSRGLLSDQDLDTFHRDGTLLAGHPVPGWSPQIPVATGSLGHGLPVALGMAFGRQQAGLPGQVYCLTSDGEWQEGSMWEAMIFLRHQKLANLTTLIDFNGLQGFGSTRAVASMDDLGERLRGFGMRTVHVDGHDHLAIAAALRSHPGAVVLLHTVKGKGVSYMENRMEWHYLPMSEAQYRQALEELELEASHLVEAGALR